jgi:hypothetical protein
MKYLIIVLSLFIFNSSFCHEQKVLYINSDFLNINPSVKYECYFTINRPNELNSWDTYKFNIFDNTNSDYKRKLNEIGLIYESAAELTLKNFKDFSNKTVCENYNELNDNKIIIAKEISRTEKSIKYMLWQLEFNGCVKNVSYLNSYKFDEEFLNPNKRRL